MAHDLEMVGKAFRCEKRLPLLLASPSLPGSRKNALLDSLSDYLQLSFLVRNFLHLLQVKDRLDLFASIEQEYRKRSDRLSGVIRARVVSALPLDESQREALQVRLKERTGRRVLLDIDEQIELIGGVRVVIEDQVLDGTIRAQLQRMAGHLYKG